MATIRNSARQYENWLKKELDGDLIKGDLAKKHEKMRENPFVFLRATYWRWSEIILDVCPELAGASQVLGIGDIHLENFGTWRDVDGRLAWGVNDFDEAAKLPYVLDLVRLAASAMLGRGKGRVTDEEICSAVLHGYRQGLEAPVAVVLDRDLQWLRELVVVPEAERTRFWSKLTSAKTRSAPKRYRKAIAEAMPQPRLSITTAPRRAGTGSLGRPRWVGTAQWHGAPVLREAKALVVSAWCRARGSKEPTIWCSKIANGRFRPVDPWYRVKNGVVVRRLSPNNRKIEVGDDNSTLLGRDMLQMMGFELANVHLGTGQRQDAIRRDLKKRKRGWLTANARKAANATTQDYKDWLAD
jgi:uncharacterized protein (DUF2252 family)